MKKFSCCILMLFVVLCSSCGSIKSTLKNVDNTAIKPVIRDGQYVITEYSKDDKYGYNKDYPINLGFDNEKYGERSVGYFFNALLGASKEKFTFKKVDSCCPFPTTRSLMGGGILDIYEIKFEGKEKATLLYINIYDKSKVVCPNGFTIK